MKARGKVKIGGKKGVRAQGAVAWDPGSLVVEGLKTVRSLESSRRRMKRCASGLNRVLGR